MISSLLSPQEYIYRVFEGGWPLNFATLFNSLILLGFILRFYRRNISPIKATSRSSAYWKNAWNFITIAILFLVFSSVVDMFKFADFDFFFGAVAARSIFDLGFLLMLTAGVHMIRKRV